MELWRNCFFEREWRFPEIVVDRLGLITLEFHYTRGNLKSSCRAAHFTKFFLAVVRSFENRLRKSYKPCSQSGV